MSFRAEVETQVVRTWLWFKGLVARGRATPFLGILSFLESFLIAIPVDPFLAAMVLADRARWVYVATVATLSSTLGAVVGYFIGFFAFDLVRVWFMSAAESSTLLATIVRLFVDHALGLTFAAALTPLPNGPVVLAAGFVGTPFLWFLVAWCLARGIRFYGVAYIVYAFGADTLSRAERVLNISTVALILLVVGWLAYRAAGI